MVKNKKKRTWHQHGLATHDEDNLHRAELRHIELPALNDGVAQLVGEDNAEIPDGDGLRDVRVQDDVLERLQIPVVERLHDIEDDEGSLVRDGD